MQPKLLAFAVSCLALPASALAGPGAGDPKAGLAYRSIIAHPATALPESLRRSVEAPPFHEVAQQKGMTATALQVWLQSSHPTMPNIVVEPKDMQNVIAYILSLKGHI